jgi:cardiolipin synthase
MSPAEGGEGLPRVALYTEGDALYAGMLEDIAAATRSIRLESYIFAADEAGMPFVEALEAAARRGLAVEVRIDAIGSYGLFPRALERGLAAAGVRFRRWRRLSLREPLRFLHRRNHRKLLVVDERVCWLGGFNIHRECSRRAVGEGRWLDYHLRIEGPAARQAALLFDHDGRLPRGARLRAADGILLLPNKTRRQRALLHRVLRQGFARARRRVMLVTPYFVPDRRTQRSLCEAAGRGVEVTVLVPAKSDVRIAQWASRAAYSRLLAGGVRIVEYLPRVLHAKAFLIDESLASVGTANLDYRSFFINDEINAFLRESRFAAVLAARIAGDLAEGREVRLKPWRRRSWLQWIPETIGWLARRWL